MDMFFPTTLCGLLVFVSVSHASSSAASRSAASNHLSHTTLSHTIFHTRNFVTHLRFAWQAWDLATSTVVLRGRHGTYGTALGLVARGPLGRS